jgi:predicted DNA-binding transcriptional regulator AlpA
VSLRGESKTRSSAVRQAAATVRTRTPSGLRGQSWLSRISAGGVIERDGASPSVPCTTNNVNQVHGDVNGKSALILMNPLAFSVYWCHVSNNDGAAWQQTAQQTNCNRRKERKMERTEQTSGPGAPVLRLVGISEVVSMTGLSEGRVVRGMREGWFPRPRKVGPRAVRWHEAAVGLVSQVPGG